MCRDFGLWMCGNAWKALVYCTVIIAWLPLDFWKIIFKLVFTSFLENNYSFFVNYLKSNFPRVNVGCLFGVWRLLHG
jgi:hypothetical protein